MNNASLADTAENTVLPPISGQVRRHVALILDDDRIDRRRLKSICDQAELNFEFHEVDSIEELRRALELRVHDIIFIDYRLNDGDGLNALRIIKTHPRHRSAATIMVAGIGQTAVAVAALKEGCSDYIMKDSLEPNWLRRAVANALDKSRLRRQFDASEELRTTLEAALAKFSKDCVSEIKPMLSRMLRQVRRLRGENGAPPQPVTLEMLEELETSCQRLWDFTEKLSNEGSRYC